uniref:Retrovirus-related Pol polyprotein from transposon TNT 1-94 n=1 Tax=Tanacetum cinerariifolium TaxID=118510 RepID=A0A6L2KTW3_TANCI|nr:retrovirus-related Pol polyprotein from transposon TNT 1-94 [Tanacetum cinerariifolium]
MAKQERESMLYDELNKFTSEPGESIHSYYLRYAKFINDMHMIPMSMSLMQIITKFVNHLQPEWSRFVTADKQAKNLHKVNFDQLYSFLKHNERDAKECWKNQATCERFVNIVGNVGANQPRVIRCYNCNGEGHIAKHCTAKKKVNDSERFKDKMLLAQLQKAEVVLNDEHHDFLPDSLEETDHCEDLQLQATTNFKADHVDAYDSDCDDEAITNAIFIENLSHVGSINDDTAETRYDSDIFFEVPHYNTYHETNVLNLNV